MYQIPNDFWPVFQNFNQMSVDSSLINMMAELHAAGRVVVSLEKSYGYKIVDGANFIEVRGALHPEGQAIIVNNKKLPMPTSKNVFEIVFAGLSNKYNEQQRAIAEKVLQQKRV
jgi:hypothetical protein